MLKAGKEDGKLHVSPILACGVREEVQIYKDTVSVGDSRASKEKHTSGMEKWMLGATTADE